MIKCESFKEEGNNYFNNHEYAKALYSYSQGISIFRYFEKGDERGEHLILKDFIMDLNDIDSASISFWDKQGNYDHAKTLIISLLLNCATACLQLREHHNVMWCCKLSFILFLIFGKSRICNVCVQFSTALKYDDKNVKALFRMCQSHQKLDTTYDLNEALKYITKAKSINPNNKAIVSKFKEIKQLLKSQNKKDKKQFNGLFQRGSIYDDKEIIVNSDNEKNEFGPSFRNVMCQKFIVGTLCVTLLILWYLFIFKVF